MFKKEKITSLEHAIHEIEDKIMKTSDPYYQKILKNLKQIQRELREIDIKGD